MKDNKPVKQYSRALIIIGLLVICLIGYFLLHQKPTDTKKYSLNNFSAFKLAGDTPGTGISFQKPIEFEQTSNTVKLKTEAQFSDSAPVSVKDGVKLVNLATTSGVSVDTVDKAYIESLKKLLQSPNTSEYKKYVAPLFDFVKLRSLKSTEIKFDNAQQLSQTNLSSKDGTKAAWLFNFSGTDKDHPDYKLKGDYIVIVSPKGFYYFFIMAKSSDWDSNQTAWDKITDSLKVDQ